MWNVFLKDGSFEVPIRAVLPQVDISVPEFLDFNMCAAKDVVHTAFEVKNTGYINSWIKKIHELRYWYSKINIFCSSF